MDDPASHYLAFLVGGSPFPTTLLKVAAKLVAVLFFVAANGFFVGAEFALVSVRRTRLEARAAAGSRRARDACRSEEHTSELQSLAYLVCRLLLEKKKKQK